MFSEKVRIRFSEVDSSGFLTMQGLLRLFQDFIYSYCETHNIGRKFARETGCTWFRLSWQIDVIKMPKILDEVTFSATITEIRQSLAYIEIKMSGADGTLFSIANDMLAFVNIEDGTPAVQTPDMWPLEDFGEGSGHEFRGRRIPVTKILKFNPLPEFKVENHFLDLNGHANNVRLIEKALEISGFQNYDVKSLRAEFKNQVLPDWTIYPSICSADGVVKVQFKNEYGLLCNLFEFSVLNYVDFI